MRMDLSTMDTDKAFPGCPYDKGKTRVRCGSCKKMYCDKGKRESTCPWCGNTGIISDKGWASVTGGGY